jgi:hypothetical protein
MYVLEMRGRKYSVLCCAPGYRSFHCEDADDERRCTLNAAKVLDALLKQTLGAKCLSEARPGMEMVVGARASTWLKGR